MPAIVLFYASVAAASPVFYYLDIHSGLPSNHVYHIHADRNGYIWIGTPQGVVRYNGYTPRIFDLSKGLPSNDIYGFYEDNRGRIWLKCFCSSLGYIYNNEYKEVVIEDPPARLFAEMWDYGGHAFLYSRYDYYHARNKIYFEQNDTLKSLRFDNGANCHNFRITEDKGLMYVKSIPMASGEDEYDIYHTKIISGQPVTTRAGQLPFKLRIGPDGTDRLQFFNDHVLLFSPAKKEISVFNWAKDRILWQWTPVPDAPVLSDVYAQDRFCFVTAGDSLYVFDESFRRNNAYHTGDISFPGYSSSYQIIKDTFWGLCAGTADAGLYIHIADAGRFPVVSAATAGFRHIGIFPDGVRYWWDGAKNDLVSLDHNGRAVYSARYKMGMVYKMIPRTDHRSLALTKYGLYIFDHATGSLTPFFHGHRLAPGTTPELYERLTRKYAQSIDIALVDSNELFSLSRSGLFHIKLKDSMLSAYVCDDSGEESRESYTRIVYDPLLQALWAYNTHTIMLYDRKGNHTPLVNNAPGQAYFRNIESILLDNTHGNVFIKEFDRLSVFNRYTGRYAVLHHNINLEKSQILLHDGMLIAAGRFGVIVNEIAGPVRLSPPVQYVHPKNIQYNEVRDLYVHDSSIFLNTDKGLFKVPLPHSKQFQLSTTKSVASYRLLAEHAGNRQALHAGDTLLLNQEDMKLILDLIRPLGNGTPKFHYRLAGTDKKWKEVNAGELTLSGLVPGRLYTFSIAASDLVWKSNYQDVYLYVTPYWWQTPAAKRLMWIAGIAAVGLVVGIAVWLTKRVVVQKNIRRNMHMEMELKSIYAQINPHFIFNTLGSAMLLIQKGKIQDAYQHVSRFSLLLRAYMKSSRNRFITIADEVENLRNYIELQQIRFKGKFDYEIILESTEVGQVRIPSLLLQPVVENAINHGLFHKQEKGFLHISFRSGTEYQEVVCVIEDDGVGRKQSKNIRKVSSLKTESYGSFLIEDLVRIFNKYEGTDISVAYTDKEVPGTGTIVTIHIKRTV